MLSHHSPHKRSRKLRMLGPAALVASAGLAVAASAPGAKQAPQAFEDVVVTVGTISLTLGTGDGTTTVTLPDGRTLSVTLEPADAASAEPAAYEVVFVLDTTGSMSGLIEGAKQKIWAIASHIQQSQNKPEVRMGLVGYRDRGDDYVTKLTPLTADIDAVHTQLMTYQAAGGGDAPESVNEALRRAIDETQWSSEQNVVRLVYLVGDAPPKAYPNEANYQTTVPKARQQGITVHTIQCGGLQGTEQHWRAIAQLGGGSYAQVEQSGGAVVVSTPYDEELAAMNREMTETIVPYGEVKLQQLAEGQMRAARELDASAPVSANADRAFFRQQNAAEMFGRGDLTTQIVEGELALGDVEGSLLPAELRKMDDAKLEAFLKAQVDRRRAAQTRIAELSKQRSEWITANAAALGERDGFDDFIARSIAKAKRTHETRSDPDGLTE